MLGVLQGCFAVAGVEARLGEHELLGSSSVCSCGYLQQSLWSLSCVGSVSWAHRAAGPGFLFKHAGRPGQQGQPPGPVAAETAAGWGPQPRPCGLLPEGLEGPAEGELSACGSHAPALLGQLARYPRMVPNVMWVYASWTGWPWKAAL